MAVSNSNRNRGIGRYWRQIVGLSRYDLVLAVIPLLFAVALAVYAVSAIPLHLAIAGVAVFCCVLLADVLYLNPPAQPPING